jgi:hypothetical protein
LFGGNTLSFVQMARLQVASFPFVADVGLSVFLVHVGLLWTGLPK